MDCGDALQGNVIGAVSNGEYPAELMNRAGYDFAVLGNHEFDYGTDEASSPFTSRELIANTRGIDAVLDGHSHSEIPCDIVKNAEGENVLLSSTGTGLCNIGRLTITANGNIQTGLIGAYPETDSEMSGCIESMEEGGDGLNMFMDNELTVDEGMVDYDILATYLTDGLNGTVGDAYALPQERIKIR